MHPNGVGAHDVAACQLLENLGFLTLAAAGDEMRDRSPDHLGGRVAENAMRAGVPARNDALQGLANDGIIGRIYHRRHSQGLLRESALRDVDHRRERFTSPSRPVEYGTCVHDGPALTPILGAK